MRLLMTPILASMLPVQNVSGRYLYSLGTVSCPGPQVGSTRGMDHRASQRRRSAGCGPP
ncbi:hypothetical protein GCM10009528_41810 [Kineococcus aurantiacus]